MKKVIASLILAVVLLPTLARADFSVIDSLQKLPGLKQGVAFDVTDSKFNYLSTIGIIKYDDAGLSAGFSSDSKLVATFTYRLGGLNRFGISTPITDLIDIEVGMYAGYGRLTGSNEFSWGPSLTVLNVKF
jgi:hypothetical protein